MSIELTLINSQGKKINFDELPTKKTYFEDGGKRGEHRGTPVKTLNYGISPSQEIPFSEILGIDRDNIKTTLVDLIKKYPSLLKNERLELTYCITNDWSFCKKYAGKLNVKILDSN